MKFERNKRYSMQELYDELKKDGNDEIYYWLADFINGQFQYVVNMLIDDGEINSESLGDPLNDDTWEMGYREICLFHEKMKSLNF